MAFTIPRNTASATLAWMENFMSVVLANGAAYGVSVAQTSTWAPLVSAFRAAFNKAGVENRVAVNPAQYTQPNREAMYLARSAAILPLQAAAQVIANNAGISDALKLTAGIAPRNYTRTRLVVPVSHPAISVSGYDVLQHLLSWHVSDFPGVKSLPRGARGVLLSGSVGTTVQSDPEMMGVVGQFARNQFRVPQYSAGDAGKIASYSARWFGSDGQVGPYSPVVSAVIAG